MLVSGHHIQALEERDKHMYVFLNMPMLCSLSEKSCPVPTEPNTAFLSFSVKY